MKRGEEEDFRRMLMAEVANKVVLVLDYVAVAHVNGALSAQRSLP
jgi:hypothetical protein